jgi:hypothetical protein
MIHFELARYRRSPNLNLPPRPRRNRNRVQAASTDLRNPRGSVPSRESGFPLVSWCLLARRGIRGEEKL